MWGGDNIALEADSSYNTTNILFRGRNLIRDSKGNNYVYDNHGDVTSILNDSGTTTKKYEYNSFGVVDDETNTSTYNPWQYCGEYRDEESGLTYLRNRYYDSSTGRFINEDPIRSGLNWYAYASHNPVMFVDPFGLMDESNIANNYFYVSLLIYSIVDNNKNLFPELRDLYKTNISSNGIELWYSVLEGNTNVSGCVYAPKGNQYNYKASGNGVQIF